MLTTTANKLGFFLDKYFSLVFAFSMAHYCNPNVVSLTTTLFLGYQLKKWGRKLYIKQRRKLKKVKKFRLIEW